MHPETRALDLDDASLAENSRGAYPIHFIPNASCENMGPVPKTIIMLTADAFGVLPPIAHLTPEQAMYHFLRSEEHTSELQSLMRISYAVFCLKKKTN